MDVRKRPGADELVQSVMAKYNIAVLSAGEQEYVEKVLRAFNWMAPKSHDGSSLAPELDVEAAKPSATFPHMMAVGVPLVLKNNMTDCKDFNQVTILGDLTWAQRYGTTELQDVVFPFFLVSVDDREDVSCWWECGYCSVTADTLRFCRFGLRLRGGTFTQWTLSQGAPQPPPCTT